MSVDTKTTRHSLKGFLLYDVIHSGRGIMALLSSGFTEVIQVLSQEASRGFTSFRMKHVYINMILCFCLSDSDNAQENRTDFKRTINSSSDSENKILYTLRF